jgi:hypothetical protein
MADAKPLEADAVEELTEEPLRAVKAHYLRRPTSRATAQEVLNALAIVLATIFMGAAECDDENGAREFFDLALEQQLAVAREEAS